MPRQLKVTHVTMHYFPGVGGQERYIRDLNSLINVNGFSLAVLQPYTGSKAEAPAHVKMIPRLRFLHRLMQGADWFWFTILLTFHRKLLTSSNIVISHYAFHLFGLPKRARVIIVSHGVDWPEKPRKVFDKVKLAMARLAVQKRLPMVVNDTHFPRSLGIDVKAGSNLFSEVVQNMWVIPNCVDVSKYRKQACEKKNIILVPRNIRKSRGIHLAIEAFAIFSKGHPAFGMQIAGGPLEGDYYRHCQNLVENKNLVGKVIFLGNVSEDQLITLYNHAMMTLIPTINFEGTSLSALESMACQTPVVSTSVGGLADLPTFKAQATAESMADAMAAVLRDFATESLRQHQETVNTFSLERWQQAWLGVMQKVNSYGE